MKIPRDVGGEELAKLLKNYGYESPGKSFLAHANKLD